MKALLIEKRKGLFTVVFLLISISNYAQQQVQFTQYMYNTMSVNPAYTGTSNKLEAYLIHRSQWVGISGAPSSQNFGVQGAIGEKIGLGLSLINDKIGPTNECYLTGNFAVRLKVSEKIKLSLGLNGGLDVLNVDWSKGQSNSDQDITMQSNIKNRVKPLIGAGTYLYGNNWYFGMSSPNFIQKDQFGRNGEAMINTNVHWYFIGGYVWTISDALKFKPAVLMKMVKGAPITVDVSANFLIREQFTAGLAYRYNDAVSLLAGYTFKKSFFIGYSYDMTLSKLRKYGSGSHDIIFKYTLFNKTQIARSPRFF